ncbi:hypothetical protein Nos7524_2290 [Nostoc sp. PCC 7524]|jgi:hypothetical protein|uniref:hypothetical protein n=1 Tax=Nostoc sp. (strain ATCC 29411 / PCC 7524) TaxID=28072 RepID=UPI00029F2D7D|nr:hypothetical protein [Nostoc sp. PCC 7524]AFY48133.1 hypothetical protein Nos7524_2290 [Nostoc sp. PCC 7524]
MQMPQRVSVRYKDTNYNTSEIRLKTFRLGLQTWEEQTKPRKTELYEFILSCIKQIDRQDRFMISLLFVELADIIRDSALDRGMKEDLIKIAFREFACAIADFEDVAKQEK